MWQRSRKLLTVASCLMLVAPLILLRSVADRFVKVLLWKLRLLSQDTKQMVIRFLWEDQTTSTRLTTAKMWCFRIFQGSWKQTKPTQRLESYLPAKLTKLALWSLRSQQK
uniref:Uncharacterized protein n=1 Tax=Brassica campestris TaxID=3711 RepID=A0A3P6CKH2_BRACM|nr:unnamed protein product [Brassica rapa]